MIESQHPALSIARQCHLVSVSRSSFYYSPTGESPLNLVLMRLIDEAFLECPFYGARQMARHLRRLGDTMEADFCIEALKDALERYRAPDIFNTDQGSQFTSPRFTDILKDAQVRISMDGRGRWMDNVFIERLWRSMKYECVYLHAFETGSELREGLGRRIAYDNARRPHSALNGQTPDEAYHQIVPTPSPECGPKTVLAMPLAA